MKQDLIDRFIGFSKSNRIYLPGETVIVALSGGGDSMAMVDLFSRINQKVILAHCNFKLRGSESDEDETFVRKIAVVYDYRLYLTEFQTREYAMANGISIEMAARELRYAWFEEIRQETESSAIAVAHHSDDSIETMFINLIRGTGLRGITGIQPRQGHLIRPMLFTNREGITNYLRFRDLEYRHDSSNQDTRYIRNRIRKIILPEIEKINPSFKQTLLEEQLLFTGAQGVVDAYNKLISYVLVKHQNGETRININRLKEEEYPGTILFELLRPFGFNGRQIKQILTSAGVFSGKVFHSRTHSLLVDRNDIIIAKGFTPDTDRYYLDPEQPADNLPMSMAWQITGDAKYEPVRSRYTACLDYEKLDCPLIIRRWEKGDFFYPLGMDHTKKVSDFFIDQKVNRLEKSQAWILTSGEKIVWIIGHRIDNRFRITEETKKILEITVQPDRS